MIKQLMGFAPAGLLLADRVAGHLNGFAAGLGHPDFPCLSRTHNPSSCVPCTDFSPWLRERVRRGDAAGVGEYFWRIRQANPGFGGSEEEFRAHFDKLATTLLDAPLTRHLGPTSDDALLDLRVAVLLIAAHEGFSGFIMTGDAADFIAMALSPHTYALIDADTLRARRNEFVDRMALEASYWTTWPPLESEALGSITPPDEPELSAVLGLLQRLPMGARVHAADALRHLSADSRMPRTLGSLSRYETRKRGLDVGESTRLILGSGLVVPAEDLEAWLAGWTRRDLLGFLAQAGVRPRNSWTKERLAEVARTECAAVLRRRMAESGAVELAPAHTKGAQLLRNYLDRVKETWRVWLAFGAIS